MKLINSFFSERRISWLKRFGVCQRQAASFLKDSTYRIMKSVWLLKTDWSILPFDRKICLFLSFCFPN